MIANTKDNKIYTDLLDSSVIGANWLVINQGNFKVNKLKHLVNVWLNRNTTSIEVLELKNCIGIYKSLKDLKFNKPL